VLAPHNRYQPHPAEPSQHTTCSNTRLVLLKMGIMMPETCWESIGNKHLTVASCWFSISLHNFLTMHGHRNLKQYYFSVGSLDETMMHLHDFIACELSAVFIYFRVWRIFFNIHMLQHERRLEQALCSQNTPNIQIIYIEMWARMSKLLKKFKWHTTKLLAETKTEVTSSRNYKIRIFSTQST